MSVASPLPGVVYPPDSRLAQYVKAGELGDKSLAEALIESFRRNAGRRAIATCGSDMSYQELDEITDRFGAAMLSLGLRPLDRVLFQSANSTELLCAVVGCIKAGLIPVCTLAAHRELEIEYLGKHTDARAHIVQADDPKTDLPAFALKTMQNIPTMRHVIALRSSNLLPGTLGFEQLIAQQQTAPAREAIARVSRDPFQVAIFQLSGGTTGVPKVIPRMHNEYLLNAKRTIDVMHFCESDVLFMPMPMMHNAAMIAFWLPCLLAGAAFAIPESMSPAAWGRIFTEKKPTFIGLIRPLLPRLDEMLDRGLGILERVRGAWSPDGARLIREKYGIPSYSMFGMSEGLNMYCRDGDPLEARDWTVGRPLSPLDEVRLVVPGTDVEVGSEEVGELTCRGPYTLSGYYNAPDRNAEAFTADGFYRTGDLMVRREIDGQHYYAFAGRTKDVVDRGAEKVSCEEVENAVSTHRDIAAAAVVGMPDRVLGERICIFVVMKSGRAPIDVAGLAEHLRSLGMAKFKWPERVEIAGELPLTKVGKLDKQSLRAAIAEKLQKEQQDA